MPCGADLGKSRFIPNAVPLSDFHCEVIDERVAEHNRNPDDVVSRDEVLAETRRD